MSDITTAIEFAKLHLDRTGSLPIILGMEIYEFFGIPVRILESDEDGLDVRVESRVGACASTEFDQLKLRPLPK